MITSKDITETGAPATLLIFNNEKGFSRKNIESICNVGRSTKKGNRKRGYIGEKRKRKDRMRPTSLPGEKDVTSPEANGSWKRKDIMRPTGLPAEKKTRIPQAPITKATKGVLKINKKLSFSDFSDTPDTFNLLEGIRIKKEEKILVDNIWVAAKRQNLAHTIASLNGLSTYLNQIEQKGTGYYVVYQGDRPGIYTSWEEVHKMISGKPICQQKFKTLEQAIAQAQKHIGPDYFIDPAIKGKAQANLAEEGPQLTVLKSQVRAMQKEELVLKQQLIEAQDREELLLEKLAALEKQQIHKEDQPSYAGVAADEAMTTEDRIMDKLRDIADDATRALSNTYTLIEEVKAQAKESSKNWEQWRLQVGNSKRATLLAGPTMTQAVEAILTDSQAQWHNISDQEMVAQRR